MSAVLISTEGKLTQKQKKSIRIIQKILFTLIKEEPLDWTGLLEKTRLAKGTLDKWLKELVRQNVVEGKIRVVNNRLIPFFTYARKSFFMKGKEETSVEEACRVYFSDKEGIVGYQWGYLKKSRSGNKYFVLPNGRKPSEQKLQN